MSVSNLVKALKTFATAGHEGVDAMKIGKLADELVAGKDVAAVAKELENLGVLERIGQSAKELRSLLQSQEVVPYRDYRPRGEIHRTFHRRYRPGP